MREGKKGRMEKLRSVKVKVETKQGKEEERDGGKVLRREAKR